MNLTEADVFPNLRYLNAAAREGLTAQGLALLRASPLVVTAEQVLSLQADGTLASSSCPDDIHGIHTEGHEWLHRSYVTR